ncbi:MAG: DUF349 domain-containing protein [Cytophagales bacterium]|nr:DUF349 domain-containing protein [Cytophagales bacterium]
MPNPIKKQKIEKSNMHPFGTFKKDKLILNAFLDYKPRELGVVKSTQEDTIKYYEDRFVKFEQKVDDLIAKINQAENKGSYLQKLLYLKEQVNVYLGLGDYKIILKKIETAEVLLHDIIQKNRVKNLALKQAILAEIEAIKDSSDWKEASEAIKDIKTRWIKIGAVDKESEEVIQNQFTSLLTHFFNRRQVFYDERSKIIDKKILKYSWLADRAELIAQNKNFAEGMPQMKALTTEWKKVGLVPKKMLEPIITRFKTIKKEYLKEFKESKAKRTPHTPSPLANLEQVKLDKLKEIYNNLLFIHKDMPENGDELVKQMYDNWKKIGHVRNSKEFLDLNNIFRYTATLTLDKYFILKQAQRKFPAFNMLNPVEKLRVQILILKDVIIKTQEHIENFENNFYVMPSEFQDGNNADKLFASKLELQKKNLLIKQKLLSEWEQKYLKATER